MVRRLPGVGKPALSACAALVAVLVSAAPAAAAPQSGPAAPEAEAEVLEYRWSLQGLVGIFARIFLPGRGDGSLVTRTGPDGRVTSELVITSKQSEAGEFWVYGSVIEPSVPETLEAWNTYRFRGRDKKKRADLRGKGTIDVPSGIHLLRKNPPEEARRMRIWTDGKVYPVEVVPLGVEMDDFDGDKIAVGHYAVRGIDVPGERSWKGSLEVWLTRDEAAVPVQIVFRHKRGKVRLRLAGDGM